MSNELYIVAISALAEKIQNLEYRTQWQDEEIEKSKATIKDLHATIDEDKDTLAMMEKQINELEGLLRDAENAKNALSADIDNLREQLSRAGGV